MRVISFTANLWGLLLCVACISVNRPAESGGPIQLSSLEVPAGFQIDLYAEGVANARAMCWGAQGTLFVGSRSAGKVYALRDEDGDQQAEVRHVIAEGLDQPLGVAFHQGTLFISDLDKIFRLADIESRLTDPPSLELVTDDLPADRWHGGKYLGVGPDEKLYVAVGAPCNICERDYEEYMHIRRMNLDGSGGEVYAKGIRNSVGFSWHPTTGELWFTDNGRDFLGDDLPPDELNRVEEAGQHFGYPYCHAGVHPDPKFGTKYPCADFQAPVQALHPHGAALGLSFYQGNMFPAAYKQRVFIAEHGSWNRSEPIGYQVSQVTLEGGQAISYEPFVRGWLADGKAWGRPVDVLEAPDGSLLISDDQAGVIYRVWYKGSL
ncbi:MAG: sorbosone dehydrogenase family protein [Bacteroidota bacterium]